MRMAERLAALAACVPPGSIVADIGTDHACLPVFLIEAGISPKVIATDLNPGPLESAARAVAKHHLEKSIELRLGNGLKVLKPGEVEVVVLAGIGGNTIKGILAAAQDVLEDIKRLVMQPMSDAGDLRIWLAGNGWKIINEKLVEEGGRIYEIIIAEQGRELFDDKQLLELGPRLIEGKDPLLGNYLGKIIEQYERMLAGLAAGKNEATLEKARQIRAKLERIREVAKCL